MALIDKVNYSISVIQKAEKLALKYQDFGFHVAFSGGKDSQVIYKLCELAGVKFKGFFYKTSVDPPKLLSFIKLNYPDVEWIIPKKTMFQLIVEKGMLPTRQARYCCEFLKERNGLNAVVITGITRAESAKRKKRNEFETSCKLGADKNLLNPILGWTESEVYLFLKTQNIEISDLYKTQGRIGCVGCPMCNSQQRIDFMNTLNFRKAYTHSVKILIEKGKYKNFKNEHDVIDWWISGLSAKEWISLNYNQYKLFK